MESENKAVQLTCSKGLPYGGVFNEPLRQIPPPEHTEELAYLNYESGPLEPYPCYACKKSGIYTRIYYLETACKAFYLCYCCANEDDTYKDYVVLPLGYRRYVPKQPTIEIQ